MKMNGVWLFGVSLLLGCTQVSAENCSYLPKVSKENPYPEVTTFKDCGSVSAGSLKLKPEHMRNLYYENNGLAAVLIGNTAFYVNKEGETRQVPIVNNGIDRFSDGLVRFISDGKYGFINQELEVVVPAEYDFAFPFHEGVALVCNGCRHIQDGEHKAVQGGLWGVLGSDGEVRIPVEHEKEKLEKSSEFESLTNKNG